MKNIYKKFFILTFIFNLFDKISPVFAMEKETSSPQRPANNRKHPEDISKELTPKGKIAELLEDSPIEEPFVVELPIEMPPEVLENIFYFLEVQSFAQVQLVCKTWWAIAQNQVNILPKGQKLIDYLTTLKGKSLNDILHYLCFYSHHSLYAVDYFYLASQL